MIHRNNKHWPIVYTFDGQATKTMINIHCKQATNLTSVARYRITDKFSHSTGPLSVVIAGTKTNKF